MKRHQLQSTTFSGEWPAGVYWSPGEVREVESAEGAPHGLEVVTPPKAKAKAKAVPDVVA
jgi:hypothetical protein